MDWAAGHNAEYAADRPARRWARRLRAARAQGRLPGLCDDCCLRFAGILIHQNYTLLFLPLLALVFGPRHPAPLNDISRLGGRHIALAILGLCVFVLLFMPAPLMLVTP